MARCRFGPFFLLALLVRPGDGGADLVAQDVATRPQEPGGAHAKLDGDTAKRLEQYKQAAGRYTIERHSDPPVALTLKAEPVFRWNSPLRTAYDGVIYVWTANGRPEAVATFYRNIRSGAIFEQHEFQSLSPVGLTASYAGQTVWDTGEPGLTLEALPGAPRPATSPAARLRQMRALAEEFGAEVIERNVASSLRLLKQPLYRFEAGQDGTGDGALFGFVHATDPEVLLVIESRSAGGVPAWHYGLARMSGWPLRARHKDRLVWERRAVPANGSYTRIRAPEQPR
jgi:hypothetical protein